MSNWVDNLQPLLPSAFPAIVRPEPEGGLTLDGLLQLTEIHLCNLVFLASLGVFGEELEFCLVVSSLDAP